MDIERDFRAGRTFTSLVALTIAVAAAAAAACESERNGDDTKADGVAPPGAEPATPGAEPASKPPPPPPNPRDFSLDTPSLGGYALVDAFPGAGIWVPAALVWPKTPGAAPFVLDRGGVVDEIAGGKTRRVLDFSSRVAARSEAGALGMALHPAFGEGSGPSPYAYFWYNATGDKQRLSRFTWNAATKTFDAGSELVLVEQSEKKAEHNAGRIAFGPDGFLYFGNGDDDDLTGGNDQRLDGGLFAGVFRIDVDSRGGAVSHPPPRQPAAGFTQGYFIPNDNPFVGVPNANEEYFALGLRNPFSLFFDRQEGTLWVGDVGDSFREEVDLVVKGGNYAWPHREGDIAGDMIRGTTPPTIGTVRAPVYAYDHASMANLSAIQGGPIYRGKLHPELVGKFVYSDWPSGRVWALDPTTTPATRTTLLDNDTERVPLALAEDNDGEIYVLHIGGIGKLVRQAPVVDVPPRLVDTTLFSDVAGLVFASKLVPYELNSPLWSDGAVKQRFIAVPPGQKVERNDDGTLKFPTGTLLVKHFELPPSVKPTGRTRRLETRVLVVGKKAVYGLTYRWNAEGTDADLVREDHDETIHDEATGRDRTWHYPSFGQCWSCHQSGRYRVLGFTPAQLNLVRADGTKQLDALAAAGVFDPATIAAFPDGATKPTDTTASLEERALSYLAANCSPCHHEGASYLGGGQTWRAEPQIPLADRGLVRHGYNNLPMAQRLGMTQWPLIEPGNPDGSILLARLETNDPDLRMPPIARNVVDDQAVALIADWIRAMPR